MFRTLQENTGSRRNFKLDKLSHIIIFIEKKTKTRFKLITLN